MNESGSDLICWAIKTRNSVNLMDIELSATKPRMWFEVWLKITGSELMSSVTGLSMVERSPDKSLTLVI